MKILKNTWQRFLVLLVAAMMITAVSCRKKVDSDSIYVGTWISRSYCTDFIEIDAASHGKYYVRGNSKDCVKGTYFDGKFRLGNRTFRIGSRKFKITGAPETVANTTMSLGGEVREVVATMKVRKPILYTGDEIELFNPGYALENLLRLEIPLISRVSSIFLVEMGVTIPSSKNLAGAKAPVELLASKRAGDLIGISTLATIPNA